MGSFNWNNHNKCNFKHIFKEKKEKKSDRLIKISKKNEAYKEIEIFLISKILVETVHTPSLLLDLIRSNTIYSQQNLLHF